MNDMQQTAEHDVIIMGGGLAGQWQARHLLLNVPGIKVAVVEPRSREKMQTVHKIGESMVEVAALFAYKELGLYEYLVENHTPKNGLNFHWPATPEKTDTVDDYFSIWNNHNPPIASFHLHRGKFETDLMDMNIEMGATWVHGRVVDLDLTEGSTSNGITVRGADGEITQLRARHVIDAAGRNWLIGKRTDNILKGPENLWGLNNGAAWVRVKGVDRKRFHEGYDPECATSHYYGTNHFFGPGHWLWMIPIANDDMSLSIGVMHHHDHIPGSDLNTREKFMAFLKANHGVLYDLIENAEPVDFKYFGQVSYRSKRMFSKDNWYVLGDAAYFGDAFYSLGTTGISYTIESITELIKNERAGDPQLEMRREAFNDFNLWYAKLIIGCYRQHPKHLGHASIMSWRIYLEYIWWFGFNVPMFVGKWHLNPSFIQTLITNCEFCFNGEIYDQLTELVERGDANLGFMDCYRADQLILDYHTPKHFDMFLENSRYAPEKVDIYNCFSKTYFYVAAWYVKFMWKGWGVQGLVRPRTIYQTLRLLKQSAKSLLRSKLHKLEKAGTPQNATVDDMRKRFEGYRHQLELQPWRPDQVTAGK